MLLAEIAVFTHMYSTALLKYLFMHWFLLSMAVVDMSRGFNMLYEWSAEEWKLCEALPPIQRANRYVVLSYQF